MYILGPLETILIPGIFHLEVLLVEEHLCRSAQLISVNHLSTIFHAHDIPGKELAGTLFWVGR